MTNVFKLTIPAGGSASNIIDLTGYKIFRIHMPAAWTTAALTLVSAAEENDTLQKTTDDSGTEISIANTVALASVDIVIDDLALAFASMTRCYLLSGTYASPVNQTVEAVIKLVAKD